MFVIVYNNSVILGPMRWNRFRFENQIQEECEYGCALPDRNDDLSPIIVSDEIKILPIEGTDNPEYNPTIQFLHGPFWEFTDTKAIMSYQVEYLPVDSAKPILKDQASAERWNRENSGVTVTLNGTEYRFATDKETRATLQNSIANLDVINWKLDRETWVSMTKEEGQSVLNVILTHVQESFNWEFNKLQEIDSCTTHEELVAVVIKEEE